MEPGVTPCEILKKKGFTNSPITICSSVVVGLCRNSICTHVWRTALVVLAYMCDHHREDLDGDSGGASGQLRDCKCVW